MVELVDTRDLKFECSIGNNRCRISLIKQFKRFTGYTALLIVI